MVARLNGVQEAAGSNPVTRTKKRGYRKIPSFFWFRESGSYTSGLLLFNHWPLRGRRGVHRRCGRWFKSSHSDQEKETCESMSLFLGPRSAPLCGAEIRFAQIIGRGYPIPSQTRPMRDEAKQTPQRPLAFQSTAAGDGTERPGLSGHPIRPLETERADGLLYGSAVCYSAISDTGVKAYAGRLT